MRLTVEQLVQAARPREYVFAYAVRPEKEPSFFVSAINKTQADLQIADARKRFGPLRLVRVEKLAS